MFSANQMNEATSSQPSNSGILRGSRHTVNLTQVPQNNTAMIANSASRTSGSQWWAKKLT